MIRLAAILYAMALPATADTLVAAHTIRAKTVLGPGDLAMVTGNQPGTVSEPADLIGMEARVTLYSGRPIRRGDVGPPAVIERNQLVKLIYARNVVSIKADGRALDRAGIGDRVRAINLGSRTTVIGTVTRDGNIRVEGNS